ATTTKEGCHLAHSCDLRSTRYSSLRCAYTGPVTSTWVRHSSRAAGNRSSSQPVASMRRYQYHQCKSTTTFEVQGKMPEYCKQHAEDSMVNVFNKRCARVSCTRLPSCNVGSSKTALYCKQHAEDGMVVVRGHRCLRDSRMTHASFNVEGNKTPSYCKRHAEDGMFNVAKKRCSREFCRKTPKNNVEGAKTPVYCEQHAEDGMVNVRDKRCLHDTCTSL
ncbi:unnamed protein product, partial [Laminaria digitata]